MVCPTQTVRPELLVTVCPVWCTVRDTIHTICVVDEMGVRRGYLMENNYNR